MKIKFTAIAGGTEYYFLLDTDKLPYSTGDNNLVLKDFVIVDERDFGKSNK